MTEQEKYIKISREKLTEIQGKLEQLSGKVKGAAPEEKKEFIRDFDRAQSDITRARELLTALNEADALQWEPIRQEFRDLLISAQSDVGRMSARW